MKAGYFKLEYSIVGMSLFEFTLLTLRWMVSDAILRRFIINMGIAVLMLNFFVRVLASVFYFAFVEHNWKYTLFTAFVLSALTYSLFLR